MAPVKPGHFKFDPGSIAQVRNRLGLSQKKLAARLGVPANTLSRWETGATTPDADSLAAIYSVAAKQGLSIQFFRKRSKAAKVAKDRTRLLVFWDFQTLRTSASHVRKADEAIRQELGARFPAVSDSSFKAFSYPSDSQATDGLMELGWGVWEDTEGLSDDIISQSKSDCGHEPEDTILVLLTHPGRDELADLVGELKSKGVAVYLMAPERLLAPWSREATRPAPISITATLFAPQSRDVPALAAAVGRKHWIALTGQAWSAGQYWWKPTVGSYW